ncbi:DUF58 domain-containing protein [Candidatus Bathyarchaeota archaeon]|nr:DUF58 domain-containing protein [Candidatus Bathyarchaeota archaeon]
MSARILTQDTIELVVTAVTFIVLGMFLGNLILISLGLTPIIFMATGLLIGQPRVVSVERQGKDIKVNVDDKVSDLLTVTIEGGPGLVTVSDILPGSFALDEGTNFKAFWKGLGPKTAEFSYMAVCAKRGYYDLREVAYEVRHPLMISSNVLGSLNAKRAVVVQPQPLFVRKIKNHKSISRIPMPMDARFRFGIPTTDFREIRDYTAGDHYRSINWKASAKLLSSKPGSFLVNEYEKEGKKQVWIFLDSAVHMALGTAVNNTMEYAIRATLGFTNFYIDRDCRVGFCVYDTDAYQWEGTFVRKEPPEIDIGVLDGIDQIEDIEPDEGTQETAVRQKTTSRVLFPDVGKRQQYKITRELLHVDIRYSSESLKEAVHSCRRYIIGTQPLFVIVTMVEPAKIKGIVDGVRELHRYVGRASTKPAIILFNVQGYSIAAQTEEEKIAAGFLTYHNKPYYDSLRGMGCIVINWDPVGESFAQALQRQKV